MKLEHRPNFFNTRNKKRPFHSVKGPFGIKGDCQGQLGFIMSVKYSEQHQEHVVNCLCHILILQTLPDLGLLFSEGSFPISEPESLQQFGNPR